MNVSVSIVVLTLNAEERIAHVLNKLDSNKYQIYIVDSSSDDNTNQICQDYNCIFSVIDRDDFNHGATRELARNLKKTDIVVFLTDDAIPLSIDTIDNLIGPIKDGKAQVAYARQIPRSKAGIFESFPRHYNYGIDSQIRSISDIEKYGVYTFFCSNSCAAWSNKALDVIGGFKPTLTNEDYIACAELMLKGYKVAYVSDATVIHSHKYSLREEFQRMFDTGYARAERPWIQNAVGSASKRGANYFNHLISKLWSDKPFLIPYAIIQTTIKYIGYKAGYSAIKLPVWVKKMLSEQKYYWGTKYYEG